MDVAIITIGDEILIGQIVDTNSAWMARQLNLAGASVIGIYTAGDSFQDISNVLKIATEQADVVLITGGLGPTKDDITKKVLSDFLNTQLVFHPPTWKRIQSLFQRWGRSTTPAHKEQCYLPASAKILLNKMGTAPGMWFKKDNKIIVSMPGVPYEMKYLMEKEIIPKLQNVFPGKKIAHRTILTVGEGESRIAARIEDFENSLPDFIKLAYLPNMGNVRLRLTAVSNEEEAMEKILDEKVNELINIIPELVYGMGQIKLEEAIGALLAERGLTLATAESCTGGFLAHKITSIPNSSRYFIGSIIAYSNEVKENQLGVQTNTLEKHGAVSEQTVIEMVNGLLQSLKANIGVSISGIAGPGGGTPQKPVGTIWLAIGDHQNTETIKLQLGKDRLRNIQYTSVKALDLIRLFIKKYYP